MSNPKPNLELLDKLEKQLVEHPEKHDQDWWISDYGRDERGRLTIDCGTTLCAAGWAATLAGCEWIGSDEIIATPEEIADERVVKWRIAPLTGERDLLEPVETVSAFSRGQRVLGLTQAEAVEMFYSSTTLEEVLDVINQVRLRAAQMEVKK